MNDNQSNVFGVKDGEIPKTENLLPTLNRPLPHDHTLERAVLSCAMQNPAWLEKRLSQIAPSMFYHPAHQTIWEAMVDQLVEGKPMDAILLTSRLRDENKLEDVGGASEIMGIFMSTEQPGIVEHYIQPLKDMMVGRQHITAFARSMSTIFKTSWHDDGAISASIEATKGIIEEAGHVPGKRLKRIGIKEAVSMVVDEIQDRTENPDKLPGWPTGLPTLDRRIRCLQPGRVTVFAGLPSDGKSAIMQNCAMGALRAGAKVGWYSLEMPITEQTLRIVAEECGVENDALYDGRMNRSQLEAMKAAIKRLSTMGAELVDTDGATATDLISDIENAGYDVAVIDYLQLIEDNSARKSDTRENIISNISRRIKKLAKRTGTHILTASQLNDSGKLRESRAIGQDADSVILVNKMPLSDPRGLPKDQVTNNEGWDDTRRIITGEKNRGGARGWHIPMWFKGAMFTFKEIE